jgi:hypothetical protein
LQARRGSGVARQQLKKIIDPLRIKSEIWRELPEKRAELVAKRKDARGEEVGEPFLDAAQFFHVRDETAAFDR